MTAAIQPILLESSLPADREPRTCGENSADAGHSGKAQEADSLECPHKTEKRHEQEDDLPPVLSPKSRAEPRNVSTKQEFGNEDRPEHPSGNGERQDKTRIGSQKLAKDNEEENKTENPHRPIQTPGENLCGGKTPCWVTISGVV